jgi:hypothetical protein
MAKTTSATGLELDDTDPEDRKIMARQRAAARQSGRTGGDRSGTARGRADLASAYDEGAAETAAPSTPAAASSKPGAVAANGGRSRAASVKATAKGLPMPRLRPPRTTSAKDAGGFLLGLVLHALVVSYIKYGSAGPTGWMKAKFLNKPVQGEDLEPPKGPNGEEAAEGQIDPHKPII